MLRSSSRVLIAGSLAAATLTGCYVVPVAPDGTPLHGAAAVAVPVAPAAVYGAPFPSVLQARLYPSNEAATRADGSTVLLRVAIDKSELADPQLGGAATAKVYCGRRAIGYVWFHDLIAFVQKMLFRI